MFDIMFLSILFVSLLPALLAAQPAPQQCEMTFNHAVWAAESFAHRFAHKYALFRFSNANHTESVAYQSGDLLPDCCRSRPILFLPGHGGDYRQARSIFQRASEAVWEAREVSKVEGARALQSSDELSRLLGEIGELCDNPFAYYSADFGGEATALLGGHAVRDQADFALAALKHIRARVIASTMGVGRRCKHISQSSDAPAAVLVAHSMGGLAARLVPLLQDYEAESISSIITIATPHAAPPILFDAELALVYRELHVGWAWRGEFDDAQSSTEQVAVLSTANFAVLSVSGGQRDVMIWEPLAVGDRLWSAKRRWRDGVACEHSDIASELGACKAFSLQPWAWVSSTFSSHVGFGIDHQALLWCRQLVDPIARAAVLASINSCGGDSVNGGKCSSWDRMIRMQSALSPRGKHVRSCHDLHHFVRLALNFFCGNDIAVLCEIRSLADISSAILLRYSSLLIVTFFTVAMVSVTRSCLLTGASLAPVHEVGKRHAFAVNFVLSLIFSLFYLVSLCTCCMHLLVSEDSHPPPLQYVISLLVSSGLFHLFRTFFSLFTPKVCQSVLFASLYPSAFLLSFIFVTLAAGLIQHYFLLPLSSFFFSTTSLFATLLILAFLTNAVLVCGALASWPCKPNARSNRSAPVSEAAVTAFVLSLTVVPCAIGPFFIAVEVLQFPQSSLHSPSSKDRSLGIALSHALVYPLFIAAVRFAYEKPDQGASTQSAKSASSQTQLASLIRPTYTFFNLLRYAAGAELGPAFPSNPLIRTVLAALTTLTILSTNVLFGSMDASTLQSHATALGLAFWLTVSILA